MFRYQQQDLLQKLLAAALQSPAAEAAAKDSGDPRSSCLVATAAVLAAVLKLQEAPGTNTGLVQSRHMHMQARQLLKYRPEDSCVFQSHPNYSHMPAATGLADLPATFLWCLSLAVLTFG